ncbi:MAG TPA: hypothetical protein ENI57_01390 [Ignavibacteria bacterium]|nr:hypothetical protein [Ignavibacteria bacterium]
MTIINFKGTIIISVILIHINFAQTTNDITPIKIDTAKLKSTNKFVEKQSLRLYELKILYNNLFNKPSLNTPGNNVIYSEPYVLSNYGYGVSDYRITDRLKLFNVSFRKLLAKDYEKRGRYDLGEIGRYLGIAKSIVTIILWLLSFRNF